MKMEEMTNLKAHDEDDFKSNSFIPTFPKNYKSVSKALWPQILFVLSNIFHSLGASMLASHSAILLPQLKSGNSSYSMDDYTASWLVSSYTISAPLGCLIGGISSDIFGRKKILIFGCLGTIAGWIMILAAQKSILFIIARIIEGSCKGMLNTAILITTDESADPKYRGLIVCSSYVGYIAGILFTASLGAIVNWWTASLISIILPIITLFICIVIPETPTWLVRKHRIQQAHRVLRWYWGDNKVQANEELQILTKRFHPSQENRRESNLLLASKISHILKKHKIFLSPHVLKPFIILHIFNTIQVTTGYAHFIFYSIEILSEVTKYSGEEFLNEYICNVILSVVRLIFIIFAVIAIYYIGRRPIALISGVGCSLSALTVAILLFIKTSSKIFNLFHWYIFIMILLFNGFYAFGLFYLPTLMIGETQPAELRSIVVGYLFTINDIILGTVLQSYYSMLNFIGIEGLFLMFGSTCVVCTVFVYFFLPETHGKTLLEIEAYFHQKNILFTTQKKYSNTIGLREETSQI